MRQSFLVFATVSLAQQKREAEASLFCWYGRQDLNLHGYPLEPKSNVSANSTTPACAESILARMCLVVNVDGAVLAFEGIKIKGFAFFCKMA